MNSTLESRFLQFCDWLKESRRLDNDRVLSNTLGITFYALSAIRTNKRGLSIGNLTNVVFNHPQLNTYWLLTGTGSMLDGKKVLVHTSRGIEEYVPPSFDPYRDGGKEEEDVFDPLRGAHHPAVLDKKAQEVLLLKREIEKWKDKYIECLEQKQQNG